MHSLFLISNATIINEGQSIKGSLLVNNGIIEDIAAGDTPLAVPDHCVVIDATGQWLLPGVIDTHVHFREPGATHKADMLSETRAAAAGGVTSFIDMPNNTPAITALELLDAKFRRAQEVSLLNYSFYLGATNENIAEIRKIPPKEVGGVKLFLGSSTGNMLVDNDATLAALFAESPVPIVAHCEDEQIIRQNMAVCKAQYGEAIPVNAHPLIRSEEACVRSTERAIAFAAKYRTPLHVLHITTAKETTLFSGDTFITAEACVPHIWFCDDAYERWQHFVKCNPAIKQQTDREAIRKALLNGIIATIGSDHAPHTREEKMLPYLSAPSGMPSLQYALPLMLELCKKKLWSPELVVEKMCHAPARLFHIHKRGFIRKGYYADMALVNPQKEWTIDHATVLSKCGWTPYAGTPVTTQVTHTFVNGCLVYKNGQLMETVTGKRLLFDR